jgi:asparagine synthetase B (glutamine-hydrolysing)
VPSPDSILAGVHKLEPGHLLLVTPEGVTVRRYWAPPRAETLALSVDDATAELRRLLEESVRLRFMSDVPFGAFLSGGIDSSIVCALMARQMDRPVKTFTIGFEGAPEDETVHARAVAKHIGAEHHEFVVTTDALAILPSLVWHMDEPLADPSILPTWAVSEMARTHVTVALSGDGGDETFAGYETYRLAQLYARLDRLPDGLKAFARARAGSGLASANFRAGCSRGPGCARTPSGRHGDRAAEAAVMDVLAPAVKGALGTTDPLARARTHIARLDAADPRALLELDLVTYMTDDVLAKVDRMSMAHALEVRVPLLDHKLVEFVSRCRSNTNAGGVSKWLLKRATQDLLPPHILARGKQGFAVPLQRWFGGRFDGIVDETLSAERRGATRHVRPDGVARLISAPVRATYRLAACCGRCSCSSCGRGRFSIAVRGPGPPTRTDHARGRRAHSPREHLHSEPDGFPPEDVGGAERQADRLAAALAARGHRVTVFTRRWPGRAAREERDGFTIVRTPIAFADLRVRCSTCAQPCSRSGASARVPTSCSRSRPSSADGRRPGSTFCSTFRLLHGSAARTSTASTAIRICSALRCSRGGRRGACWCRAPRTANGCSPRSPCAIPCAPSGWRNASTSSETESTCPPPSRRAGAIGCSWAVSSRTRAWATC